MSWRAQVSRTVRELRIHLCQTSDSSNATRDFILRNYQDLKLLNPRLPILIRECSGIEPRLWARFDRGVELSVPLQGLDVYQIEGKLEALSKGGSDQVDVESPAQEQQALAA